MQLKYFINSLNKEYELILSGDVGATINGKEIASEIRYLNTIGATKITQRINSHGGNVIDGYDIIDANINSKAIIETIITGLAASTAGWIAATGTPGNRFIVDYGKGMIHDPSLGNRKIEDMEEGSSKNALIEIKDSIATILSNNSNIKKETINEMMTKETWLNAEQWVSMGFADQILSTSKKPKVEDNYSVLEFMNACDNIQSNLIINDMDIKELENKVENLAGQITAKDELISSLENKVSEKETELDELKNEIEKQKETIADFRKLEIENAVKSAIDSKKFNEADVDKLTEQCKAMGVENFVSMVDMVAIPKVDVISQIKNGSGDEPTAKKTPEQKLADEYQNLMENDSEELIRIKNFEPKRFETMLNAWNQA